MIVGNAEIGIVGLGTMGYNLALNIISKGFPLAAYDIEDGKVEQLTREKQDISTGAQSLPDLIKAVRRPRAIIILVPAGKVVDDIIHEMEDHLDAGDVLIDGGNSHFSDTERRQDYLKHSGVIFMGLGISGGADGALHGPSMMPGGEVKGWERVRHIFESIAARYKGEPCVRYLGNASVGHYVKMVHNGIEYALMQLLAESYDTLHHGIGLSLTEIGELFKRWNEGKLQSYLLEISAAIMLQKDMNGESHLLSKISDRSETKGTGKWVSQDAMELGIEVPNIAWSVAMRYLSSRSKEREKASSILSMQIDPWKVDANDLEKLEQALYISFIICYAQGFSQLRAASSAYSYYLRLEDVASVWREGCIIRSRLLDLFKDAFEADANLLNPILDPRLGAIVQQFHQSLRTVVEKSVRAGISTPVFSSSLAYLDAYRKSRLPSNLIQAQRDFFGAHSYERTDIDGTFTTEWKGLNYGK